METVIPRIRVRKLSHRKSSLIHVSRLVHDNVRILRDSEKQLQTSEWLLGYDTKKKRYGRSTAKKKAVTALRVTLNLMRRDP